MVNVVICDDSLIVRKILEKLLSENKEINVVKTFSKGEDVIEFIKNNVGKIDVILQDYILPGINGLEVLRKIKTIDRGIQFIFLSALNDAKVTIQALEEGAFDFIIKPSGGSSIAVYQLKNDLINKVLEAYNQKDKKKISTIASKVSVSDKFSKTESISNIKISQKAGNLRKYVAIGVSTGGPKALSKIFEKLDRFDDVAIFIYQHMPPAFTSILADRLDETSKWNVKEAEDGEYAKGGHVYVTPGERNLDLNNKGGLIYINLVKPLPEHIYKPNINYCFRQVLANIKPEQIIGIILTGMGDDGAKALLEMRKAGCYTIAQDKETSTVWGMPRVAAEIGAAKEILPIDKIGERLNVLLKK